MLHQGTGYAEKAIMSVQNKKGKTFNVTSDEVDRDPVEFYNCRDCSINFDFSFKKSQTLEEGYTKWQKSNNRVKQLVFFRQCSNLKVVENHSLEACYVFIDCTDCKVKLTNCNQAVDIVNSTSIVLHAPVVEEFRVYSSKSVTLKCNTHCHLMSCGNEGFDVDRKWDINEYMKSDRYQELVERLSLEDM